MTQLVHSLATESTLGEEVASNEPVFSKCERKPQSQLVKVPASQCVTVIISANIYFPQDMVQYNIGSLSRITFHYPPTFTERDVVIIISRCDFLQFLCVVLTIKNVSRFMRTKKDRDRYKFKQDEIIANVIEGKANDRRESKVNIPLSYGTV